MNIIAFFRRMFPAAISETAEPPKPTRNPRKPRPRKKRPAKKLSASSVSSVVNKKK